MVSFKEKELSIDLVKTIIAKKNYIYILKLTNNYTKYSFIGKDDSKRRQNLSANCKLFMPCFPHVPCNAKE